MAKVLITAFEPYDQWRTNSSWSALMEVAKDLPEEPRVVTRRYPVDYAVARQRLKQDISAGDFDYAVHLGQAPGSARLRLEAVGLNLATSPGETPGFARPLVENGPTAFHTALPLAEWAEKLRAAGVPAVVSFHAGTYLCNALLYLSHYFAQEMQLKTRSFFLHIPLEPAQVLETREELPTLSPVLAAAAIQLLLAEMK